MPYIGGFLLAVPTANEDAYRKMAEMPFDGMRMMWGGFEPLVSLGK